LKNAQGIDAITTEMLQIGWNSTVKVMQCFCGKWEQMPEEWGKSNYHIFT